MNGTKQDVSFVLGGKPVKNKHCSGIEVKTPSPIPADLWEKAFGLVYQHYASVYVLVDGIPVLSTQTDEGFHCAIRDHLRQKHRLLCPAGELF